MWGFEQTAAAAAAVAPTAAPPAAILRLAPQSLTPSSRLWPPGHGARPLLLSHLAAPALKEGQRGLR